MNPNNDTHPLIIDNGTIECHAPHQLAYMDSYVTCIAFPMPFYMEAYGFGYISGFLSMLIIICSLFIKNSYKYFIINQAFWELLISYDFICDQPSNKWFKLVTTEVRKLWGREKLSTCIYSGSSETLGFQNIVNFFITSGPFSSLLLLAFSRVLAMYFNNFYKKLMSPLKATFIIIIFSLIYVCLISCTSIYQHIIISQGMAKCGPICFNTTSDCLQSMKGYAQCLSNEMNATPALGDFMALAAQRIFEYFVATAIVLITIACMVATIYKVITQIYLQRKLKQKLTLSSFKIAIVLSFQCFTLCFIFVNPYLYTLIDRFIAPRLHFLISWPNWFKQVVPKCITVLRSIVDSIIILTVLTEYRQVIHSFGKQVILIFYKPFYPSRPETTMMFTKSIAH